MSSRYSEVHATAAGPGDSRPTAADVVKDEGMTGKLVGKVFLITGCSAGIGIETARALLATGVFEYVAPCEQTDSDFVDHVFRHRLIMTGPAFRC